MFFWLIERNLSWLEAHHLGFEHIVKETLYTTDLETFNKHRELRKQYYGAQAYDFTDASLFNAANQSLTANKPDDAIAFAQLNLAFNARSARSYQVMSQAYQRKNDKDKAIQALEKAVEIDPSYAAAHNDLAIAYEHEGQLDKARKAYEKAVELEPNNLQIRQNFELFKEINDRTSPGKETSQ